MCSMYVGVSNNQGPQSRPQTVGLLCKDTDKKDSQLLETAMWAISYHCPISSCYASSVPPRSPANQRFGPDPHFAWISKSPSLRPICIPPQPGSLITLGLQVYKEYLLWPLKYIDMTYFGLLGAPGICTLKSRVCRVPMCNFPASFVRGPVHW